MNTEWYLCKIKYDKVNENGLTKQVLEQYLVGAMTPSDAEKIVVDYLTPYIVGDLSVIGVTVTKYNEIYYSDEEKYWYKFKISLITLNEKTGIEKENKFQVLVQCDNIQEAFKRIVKEMRNSVSDYRIISITETKILDVITEEKQEPLPD